MSKVHIITYGCTANQADSQIMEAVLEKVGHKVSDFDSSDYVLVNTCAVKEATENKIISKLSKLAKTDKKIIIGGCLPKVNLERIKRAVPSFAGILDTRSVDKLPEILKKIELGENKVIQFSDQPPVKPNLVKKIPNTVSGIVQLSEGCDLSCTYCATTIARGDLVCFSPEDIVRGVSYLVKQGCKEILLTSQDNGAYSFAENKIPKLLESISAIDGEFFIRNGMTNPMYLKSFLKQLIEIYKNPKIYKFLHIPVQSGSNKILQKMKRGYKVEFFEKVIEEFRREIPEITISTDIIVGFPGETERDFDETVNLIERTRPDVINISKFGSRPGTEAAKMKQVDKKELNKRSVILSSIIKKIFLETNKKWVGWKGKCLVNEVGKNGNLIARNSSYKPIVLDDEYEGRGGNRRFPLFGKLVEVEIVKAKETYLLGKLTKAL